MQAEIIAIGDEILIGQTIDTNSTFIATQLNLNGIQVRQKRVIADDAIAIAQALDQIRPDTQLVFMTGGLGPTKDDITKKTLCDYFGGEMVFHPEVFTNIERLFQSYNRVPSESNRSQAFLPSSCEPIINEIGTASAMHFTRNGVHYFSSPGVPYETEYLVKDKIVPWIVEKLQKGNVVHRTVLTQGIPESELADRISEWEESLPPNIKLAYLPSPGIVKLRLSSYQEDSAIAMRTIEEQAEKLRNILGDVIFGGEAQTLEEVVGQLLRAGKFTLATAESCTGGYIAHLITQVPGSSDYYQGGVISYANQVKEDQLGVNPDDIKNHGAVSKEVVEQMALGVQKRLKTDFAIATSGVAGPGGGSDEKPVGTIWIATASPDGVKSKVFRFGKHRGRNIQKSGLMALDLLRREIQKFQS
ncbi:MAG: competence/damage-inducible protein A [Owenweeksia sp.]